MLRSVLVATRLPYTCLVGTWKESGPRLASWSCDRSQQRLYKTDVPLGVLDKDHPHKKTAVKDEEDTTREFGEFKIEEFRPGTLFPTEETHSMIIEGVRFDELPIIHIKATHNNTILSATDYKGQPVASESSGTVGFRNAKKGTNIAAQAAAVSLGEKAVQKGLKTVRVSVRGIGPGRLAALKGLQMAGMTIVSITDATRLPHNGNRPRKQRRL